MTKVIRVYNRSGQDDTWMGQLISNAGYVELSEDMGRIWSDDDEVFQSIGSGDLTVNDGAGDIKDPTAGYKWLSGNDTPPRTSEGIWQQMLVAPSQLAGNKGINWVMNTYIEAGAEYEETMTVPDGMTFVLNWVAVDSPTVPSHTTVTWEYWSEAKGKFIMVAPDVCPVSQFSMKVKETVATSGVSTISVTAAPKFSLDYIEPETLWVFASSNGTTVQHTRITSADSSAKTITLSAPTVHPLNEDSYITLVERPVASIGTVGSPGKLDWAAPVTFEGNGKNFVNIKIRNVDESLAGQCTVMVNGYLTPTEGE